MGWVFAKVFQLDPYEMITSFTFVVANFAILYVLTSVTPNSQYLTDVNSFKLDCITIANLAAVNLSTNYSRNLNTSLLDQYANNNLNFNPNYTVRFEIENLENGKSWTIGEIPEVLPDKYKDFKANFSFPVLIEGNLGRLNVTCAKVE